MGKGGSSARISVISWRERFVWSQLGFSNDRGLLVIPPSDCLQEAEDRSLRFKLRKAGAGPWSSPTTNPGWGKQCRAHREVSHSDLSPVVPSGLIVGALGW